MARPWRFYVYRLIDASGAVCYIGKGSANRLRSQCKSRRLVGEEIARFRREKDAYAFERAQIADLKPSLNAHPGGNGSRAQPVFEPKWVREIDKVGTRRYAARVLLALAADLINPSEIEGIRQVAHGPRC